MQKMFGKMYFTPSINLRDGNTPQMLFLGKYDRKSRPKLKQGDTVRVIIYNE